MLLKDCGSAVLELARARCQVAHFSPSQISLGDLLPSQPDKDSDVLYVERVAYVIPRVAAYLPWRSDCLVQALAARRWLKRKGIPSTLRIGVKRESGNFSSHAWLVHGDRIVTGGDISGYTPLGREA